VIVPTSRFVRSQFNRPFEQPTCEERAKDEDMRTVDSDSRICVS